MAITPLNLVMVSLGIFQLAMFTIFGIKGMYGFAAVTLILLCFTTGLYFILLCCRQLPYVNHSTYYKGMSESHVSQEFTRISYGAVEGSPVTSRSGILSPNSLNCTSDPSETYEHPALATYLNGRTLHEVIAGGSMA